MSDSGDFVRRKTFDVFCGNLPDDICETDLTDGFQKFGAIQSLNIFDGKNPVHPGKIAFVRFLNESEAHQAASGMNGTSMKGQHINTKVSDRNQKPGGPGGDNKMDRTNSNKPDIVPHYLPSKKPQQQNQWQKSQVKDGGKTEYICISHHVGPCQFWAHLEEHMQDLMKLSDDLRVLCLNATPIQGPPQQNKLYATKFSEDGQWYRCKMTNKKMDDKSEVLYIDYGNSEFVENSAIVELPPSISNIRPQAQLYVLYGLKPIYFDPDTLGFTKGVELLKSLTTGKIKATTYRNVLNTFNAVVLENGNIDVNQEILNAGYAEKRVIRPAVSPYQQNSPRPGPQLPSAFTKPPQKPTPPPLQLTKDLIQGKKVHDPNFSLPHQSALMPIPDQFQQAPPELKPGVGVPHIPPPMSSSNQFQSMAGYTGGYNDQNMSVTTQANLTQMPIGTWDASGSNNKEIQWKGPASGNGNPTEAWDSGDPNSSAKKWDMSVQPPTMAPGWINRALSPTQNTELDRLRQELKMTQQELHKVKAEKDNLLQMQISQAQVSEEVKFMLQQERDQALMQHTTTRSRLKSVEQDLSQLQVHCAKYQAQLKQSNLDQKMKCVLAGVNRVKQIRLQFPSEMEKDNIDLAVCLVTSSAGRINPRNMGVIPKTNHAIQEYFTAQESVKGCTNLEEFPELIAKKKKVPTATLR